MATITTIVHFSLPKEKMDELLVIWKKIRDIMLKQRGPWMASFIARSMTARGFSS
jgi:hypothetical protein